MRKELALHGGSKAVPSPLPGFLNATGRTFGKEEEELVLRALRSGCLSRNGGEMVERLEQAFAEKLGVERAVACSSGTASVHLAVAALDPEPGDEFITTPITDIGSLLPILWQGCIPVFADVDSRTLTLDPNDVERKITPRTRAVLAVHLAGQPCDLDRLLKITRRHHVALIEDCSQAYWAEYDGQRVGTLGELACFSLQQSKHITCGEGGLMVTSKKEYAERARLFADKAWPRDVEGLGDFRFLFLSQNYRMSELQGAVALAQLEKIESVVARRRERAEQLTRALNGREGIYPPFVPANTRPSYWLYMLHLDEEALGVGTKEFGEALLAEGVPAWVQYCAKPLYCSPLFEGQRTYGRSAYPFSAFGSQDFGPGLCPQAEKTLKTVIAVHWNENYTPDHVDQIQAAIEKVADYWQQERIAGLEKR